MSKVSKQISIVYETNALYLEIKLTLCTLDIGLHLISLEGSAGIKRHNGIRQKNNNSDAQKL